MKKVDFTIKGTKLPAIPKGTEGAYEELYNLISYGVIRDDIILAEEKDNTDSTHYIFKLSTIEALAEEQGMLYEKEEERDWTGVRFKKVNRGIIKELEFIGNWGYVIKGDVSVIYTQEYVNRLFSNGTWIEVKEEQPPVPIPPSLQSLLQKATVAEYHIRTGCQMFIGVDEVERLEQMKACERELKDAILQLNTLLNE